MDTCFDCIFEVENPHYGECGDVYTGYCTKKDKPVDVNDLSCNDFDGEDSHEKI